MQIRPMTEADLAAADELRRLAGWNQTLEDWRLLLGLEPKGCFLAIEDNGVVGTVTTTAYGPELAWIGMMLVHPERRRQGIGTRLMRTALDYLQGCGIACIRLDATPAGRPVYEKLGFVCEWNLTRHQGAAVAGRLLNTRELVEADWPAVEKLDAAAFGVARGHILRALAQRSRATMVTPAEGPIIGFGMLRRGSHCDYLGPAAGDGSLICALLENATGPVFWDVPDDNHQARALAEHLGFEQVRPLTRMRCGPDTVKSDPEAQLGIADPSLG